MTKVKYLIENKELMREWEYEKNCQLNLDPTKLGYYSNKKAWWKCIKGHEWESTISSRSQGNGCPYCSGRYAIIGKNDLQTVNPTLAKEWNYERNKDLTPNIVLPNSGRKVWWKCIKGHEWESTISSRSQGNGCPYCGNKKFLKGYNDLQTVNPILAKEWNYERNGELTPTDVFPNSGKKVWWRCSKGHEWQAKIYHRNTVSGCPICKSERNTSLPEFAILYYFRKAGLNVIHTYKEYGFELDLYIPSKKIAVEYDGYFWHKNKLKKDLEKNQWCKMNGILLYRIREGLPALNDYSIDYIIDKDNKDELSNSIVDIIRKISNLNIDVNIERDTIDIENLREYVEKENSISILNPVLALEWNYEKNLNLKPEFFAVNSGKKVWWKCSKGHEWQAVINSRNKGNGCPYCSGLYVIKGYNDLQTVNPTLAKEWNYERNIELNPSDVLPNSEKKVWWKCSKGHEWQAMIGNRQKGIGCPYCANKLVLQGYNDLQTINPSLAKEWNYIKNEGLEPSNVVYNSNKKVWWKCSRGHEWNTTIYHRMHSGSGCPYCANKAVLKGFNDLQTINPSLAREWNYQRNEGLMPYDVVPNSNKRVWWKCSKGHEWQAYINNRNQGNKCPYCSGLYVIEGYNDLLTTHPTLSKEWNYEKNSGLTPTEVSSGSGKKVWWICENGHEWQAKIYSRSKGNGCPQCAIKKRTRHNKE